MNFFCRTKRGERRVEPVTVNQDSRKLGLQSPDLPGYFDSKSRNLPGNLDQSGKLRLQIKMKIRIYKVRKVLISQ